jgi:hypothetical protein
MGSAQRATCSVLFSAPRDGTPPQRGQIHPVRRDSVAAWRQGEDRPQSYKQVLRTDCANKCRRTNQFSWTAACVDHGPVGFPRVWRESCGPPLEKRSTVARAVRWCSPSSPSGYRHLRQYQPRMPQGVDRSVSCPLADRQHQRDAFIQIIGAACHCRSNRGTSCGPVGKPGPCPCGTRQTSWP